MRPTLPFILATVVLLSPGVAAADDSVTVNDLVKLSAAGLGDDILVALIESHDTVFKLGADDVLALRERGLSQKVILAMIQTATRPKARPVEPAPLQAIDVPAPEPSRVDAVAQEPPPPVVVNVTQQVEQHVEQPRESERYMRVPVAYPVAVPVYVAPARPQPKPAPVYWGFGGQRRPDTWRDPKDPKKDK
jgi:hypothetical protein